MPITWRPATWTDIEPALSIQPTNRGDGFVGVKPALEFWRYFLRNPFFLSAVVEARPAIHGHRLIGLGAAVLVSREFMDAEIAHPRPDLTARIMASI